MKKSVWIVLIVGFISAACQPPQVKVFNHRETLFPLKGIHTTIHCRECHKDGAITSLPTSCINCHPMSVSHTKNLGDCDMCHTQVTFAAAFFNHRRAGVPMYGAHLAIAASGCFGICHNKSSYKVPGGFVCSNCHSQHIQDGTVHVSNTQDCSRCHTQFAWVPAFYKTHQSYTTKLSGAHASLRCSRCHTSPFSVWTNINWRDGLTYKPDCAACHTRNYKPGESAHSAGLAANANCGSCHGYSKFDD